MAFNHPPSYLLTAALNFSMNMRTEMLREANAFRSMVYMRHVQSHERASAAMATCAECYPLAPDAGSSNAIGPVALSPAQRFWYSLIQSAQSLAWSSRSSSSMSAAVHTSVPTTSGSGAGPLLDFVVSMQGEWRMAFAMMTEQRYAEVQLGMDALVGHNWQVGLANHLHGTGVSEWQQLLLDLGVWMATNDCRWVILGTQLRYRIIHLVYVPLPSSRRQTVAPRARPHLVLSTSTLTTSPRSLEYPLVEVMAWLIATGAGPFTLAQLGGAFDA